jgi:hypothetical protein
MSNVETILLSEYFGEGNGKTAKVNKWGKWYIAELYQDDLLISRDSQLDEDNAEAAAEEWIHDSI